MKRVLYLTKNILVEKEMQRKLQELNYEVYCSSDSLNSLFNNEDISGLVSYFHLVLLSVTFSDVEIQQILTELENFSIPIIRESELIPSKEEQQKWYDLGVVGWIQKEDCIQVLREKIARAIYSGEVFSEEARSFSFINFQQLNKKANLLSIQLSKSENKILLELKKAETSALSRTELCELLWSDGESPSHLSQLSMHIKRIKEKYKEAGYYDETILTDWGKGYRLSETFHEFLNQIEETKQQDINESDTDQDTNIAEISSVISF